MTISLGCKLAYIAYEQELGSDKIYTHMSRDELKSIEELKNKLKQIRSDDFSDDIFEHIPDSPCHSEQTFLLDNFGFFHSILLNRTAIPSEKSCYRFTRHMNDCFQCFEEFCHVVRDFHFKYNELVAE